ncbi:hypothetical protein B296_00008099 [Ensete ventricosum]|uniref:Uncharacterized protein n=1 Tax=Ensete ventricosum TaxID=4639 RepID=A0A427A3X6_ENSVE|nr:hypothetical protein B296_00008099 [Ensete ventricosum]
MLRQKLLRHREEEERSGDSSGDGEGQRRGWQWRWQGRDNGLEIVGCVQSRVGRRQWQARHGRKVAAWGVVEARLQQREEQVAATLLCAGGEEGSNVGSTVGSGDRRRALKRRGGRWRLGNDSGKGGRRGNGQASEDCARQRMGKGSGGVGKGNQRWRGVVVGGDGSWQVPEGEAAAEEAKKSNHVTRKLEKRQQGRTLDPHIEEQFGAGRLLACISSRPGQCGRADG